MNSILESGWENYKGLYNIMLQSTKNVLTMQNMIKSFRETNETYANSIQKVAENFHNEISSEKNEEDVLVFYYQYLSNYLLRVANDHQNLVKNINSEIIEPFEMFVQNYRQTNRDTATKGKQLLIQYEDSRSTMLKAKENYLNKSKQADESSEIIEKIIQQMDEGQKTQSDLQKASDRSVKLKITAQETEQIYKQQIDNCNDSSELFNKQFKEIFTSFDYNDESRVSFSKHTITNLVKQLISHQSESSAMDVAHEEKLNEYEEKFQSGGNQRVPCFKLLQKKFRKLDFEPKKEVFESFELYKENVLMQQQKKMEDEFEVIDSKDFTQKDQKILEKIIDNLLDSKVDKLAVTQKKQQQNKQNNNSSNTSQSSLNSSQHSVQEEEKSNEKGGLSQDILKHVHKDELNNNIKDIFKNQLGRLHFLDRLWRKLQENRQFHFKCSEEKFHELFLIIQYILIENTREDNFQKEEFYLVLQISSRIVKIPHQKKNQGILQVSMSMIKYINHLEIFHKKENWLHMYDYIQHKKIEEKLQKHRLINEQNDGSLQKNVKKGMTMVSKGIGFGLSVLGIANPSQNKNNNEQKEQIKESEKNEINFIILSDINVYLLNLQLPIEFTTDLIIDIALNIGCDNEKIAKLLEKQEEGKNDDFRKQFFTAKKINQKRTDKLQKIEKNHTLKTIFIIKQSLQFLSAEDKPLNLLLLCRESRKQLEKKVFKIFLMRDFKNNEFLKMKRISIYKAWLKTDLYKNLDYLKMKQTMIKAREGQKKQERIEEIIDLDVQRSLHIHKDDISQDTLANLLKTFAHENQVISYCQGMNYIAGYLYLVIRDECETYKQFHIIMNLYFQDLFTDQFHRLKIMFYQLTRCISIFLPQLSDHLKCENIDPQYYATGWFITIFTSVFQYALQSHLLNVFWDIFIIEGWKGFFKCVLWMLKHHQSALLSMQFDELLHYLGEIIKSEFFQLSEQDLKSSGLISSIETIKEEILEFNITHKFLNDIEQEYECFQLNVNKKIKQIKENNKQLDKKQQSQKNSKDD